MPVGAKPLRTNCYFIIFAYQLKAIDFAARNL